MSEHNEPLIVVGVDGSKSSRAALRWGVQQAQLVGGRVHALMSWEWPNPFSLVGPALEAAAPDEDVVTLEETTRRKIIEVVQDTLGGKDPGVSVHGRVVQGSPARVLVEASQDAALLVVGTRGYGGFKGALLGSVSTQVTQYAHCSVVVVREPPES